MYLNALHVFQESLHYLAVRIVGCGFTLAHLKFQRISVVTSCMGEDLESDVSTLGYGRVVPDECSVGEVSSTFVFGRCHLP